MAEPRRFPPPWTIDEMNDACFIVSDKNGHALGYFLFRGGAGPTGGRQLADQGRGPPHGSQLRQAAGVVEAVISACAFLWLDAKK